MWPVMDKKIIINIKYGFASLCTLYPGNYSRFSRPWYKSITALELSFHPLNAGVYRNAQKDSLASPVIPVNPGPVLFSPPCLWGVLLSWQPCGSICLSLGILECLFLPGAAEGKDTRLSLKRKKKKKKLDLVKGIVFWLRGHAGQKSHVKKDAWDDDKVLTCLYSRIHFVLNCATFCVTNLLLSRVCKDQKMLIFSQNLRKDHYRTMTWWWVEVIKCFHWDVRLSDGLTSSVCVSGFVWAFFLTQSKHRSSKDPRLHLYISRVCSCLYPRQL